MNFLIALTLALLAGTCAHATEFPLESLDLQHMGQDSGTPHAALSVNDKPISIGGHKYVHGVGTHATSELRVALHSGALRFAAEVGVDDEVASTGFGSVQFEVFVDGKRQAQSKVLKAGDAPEHLEVSLLGAKTLFLRVNDGGDGNLWDHADWADAVIEMKPAAPAPQSIPAPEDPVMPIAMGLQDRPEIHGPRVLGCTPGRPILFKIPVTGRGTLRYRASGLPNGLKLNPVTGVLSGTPTQGGIFKLRLVVDGSASRDRRTLTLHCGQHLLALTPPMGWNSWNAHGPKIDADTVRRAADSFVTKRLIDFGYRYINIDDGWADARDAAGAIVPNHKFPDMKGLVDYVHARGLSIGLYSSPGPKTCEGLEGSLGHEEQDATRYALWGFDYLKYDWCSYEKLVPDPPSLDQAQEPFVRMRRALDSTGRDMVFSLSQYGMASVHRWGKEVGANLWRTTGDILDTYRSVSTIASAQLDKASFSGPGGWNDPDMLVVGRLGQAWGEPMRPTRLQGNEQIMHVSLWAMLGAPLILGCDLDQLDDWTLALITNHDVIEVDQDPSGRPVRRVAQTDTGAQVWKKVLWDGSLAVAFINFGEHTQSISASWTQLEILGPQPVRDLWERKNLGRHQNVLKAEVPLHGVKLFRVGQIRND